MSSRIGVTPNSITYKNAETLRAKLYPPNDKKMAPKYKVGQKVRISKVKMLHDRGFHVSWTDEIFTIASIEKKKVPITYRLVDCNKKALEPQFYPQELVPVGQDTETTYRIHILRSRKNKKGELEHLVHWYGYGSEHDCFIKDSDLV